MYALITGNLATMTELKYVYTLDEALKLYALNRMNKDIERGMNEELRQSAKK